MSDARASVAVIDSWQTVGPSRHTVRPGTSYCSCRRTAIRCRVLHARNPGFVDKFRGLRQSADFASRCPLEAPDPPPSGLTAMTLRHGISRRSRVRSAIAAALAAALVFTAGCGKEEKKEAGTATGRSDGADGRRREDVPISSVFVAQTQSSQAVNIAGARIRLPRQARLHRRLGGQGRPGAVPDGPEAVPGAGRRRRGRAAAQPGCARSGAGQPGAHQAARRSRTRCRRRTWTTRKGQYEQAAAAVAQSKAQLESASSTFRTRRSRSPVDGVSSFAAVADGTYVNAQNSQLTTVSVLTPMWINFSVSENEMERIRGEVQKGLIKLPEDNQFVGRDRARRRHAVPVQGQDHVRRSRRTTRRPARS